MTQTAILAFTFQYCLGCGRQPIIYIRAELISTAYTIIYLSNLEQHNGGKR